MSRSSCSLEYKTDGQVCSMCKVGLVVVATHAASRKEIRVGVTMRRMDELARGILETHRAWSNFYGYYGYPTQVCISVNDKIVYGIPGERVLEAGNLMSFDCGAVLDGWHGDVAFSIAISGKDTPMRTCLYEIAETSVWHDVAAMATGGRMGGVGRVTDDLVIGLPNPPGIILDYVGYGIGSVMHVPPDAPNFRFHGHGLWLRSGMVFCIEPMLTVGDQVS